jgi:hypothetical protein
MSDTRDDDLESIRARNDLRTEVGLPLLDIRTEMARLAAMLEKAEFEREFERRLPELRHHWTGNSDGWIANMGRYCMARNCVRKEMRDLT